MPKTPNHYGLDGGDKAGGRWGLAAAADDDDDERWTTAEETTSAALKDDDDDDDVRWISHDVTGRVGGKRHWPD